MKNRTIVWSGERIAKPGIYANVPLEVYHSQQICDGPSVSSSGLRRVLEENGGSPAHFFCEWSGNKEAVEPKEKKAWVFGRACHHVMLGQPDFASEFVFRPERVRDKHGIGWLEWHSNRTECRQWLAQAAAGGATWDAKREVWVRAEKQPPMTVLTGEDARHIRGIAEALAQSKIVQQGILSGQIERSFFWQDKRTKLWLKARPDSVPTDSGDFADLKTTTSVQYPDLARTISACAYHQQAALIAEGSQVCAEIKMNTFALVFVEKVPPYCVRVVVMRDEDIALGARQNRRALEIIAACQERGHWPGPGEDHIVHIDLGDRYAESAKLNNETWEKEQRAA